MKREIKFRAWDAENNKWLLGYEYPNLGGFSMKGECMLFGEYVNVLSRFALHKFDSLVLMQFTGLTDKNGKEIYEGDIVAQYAGNKYIIEWDDRCGCYVLAIIYKDTPEGIHQTHKQIPIDAGGLCVIGNIYESPDLLTN